MDITVETTSFDATRGLLKIGAHSFPCTLGRSGVTTDKKEGDRKTPAGTFPLREVYYRADHVSQPKTDLVLTVLTQDIGWCEDPKHPDYNKKVTLPHAVVRDRMFRDDHLFDYIIVVGCNDAPVVPGKGSAIFIHLMQDAMTPTAGCIGLSAENMQAVLGLCKKDSKITILPPPDSSH